MNKAAGVLIAAITCVGLAHAQTDPGPRGLPINAGGPFTGLSFAEQTYFFATADVFKEIDSVSGNSVPHNITGEPGVGLGPAYNGNSCAVCHAEPTVGGSSPGLNSAINPVQNPEIALATTDGATNVVPSFVLADGPVVEARFISTDATNVNAPLDGGVHNLYTIKGRRDAPGCNLQQPNFATQLLRGNISKRIPTPLFGLGLVENTPDATLQANLAATATARAALNIGGRFNTSGNDGTITRFGWKAQNPSVLVFSGEAYNVEQGVTNEAFAQERSAISGCTFNSTPEDHTHLITSAGNTTGTADEMSADVVNFAGFIRLSAPPTPNSATSLHTANGSAKFDSVGCALCHSRSLTTAASPYTGMSNFTYHPLSDFALHHMGPLLTDGIRQGQAGPDEFRTAPLWGLGQRLFFLHDGRTKSLLDAILDHTSNNSACDFVQNAEQFVAAGFNFSPSITTQFCTSEADKVISGFRALSSTDQQDVLTYLRTL